MTAICETSREQLVRMIEAAILAPSAENTQPWRFAIDGDRLLVGIDRSRTLASDVDDMLTLTGIGAAIENAVIAARGEGLEPTVVYRGNGNCDEYGDDREIRPNGDGEFEAIAEITTTPAATSDPLYPYLAKRCTTRRLKAEPIAPEVLQRLADAAAEFPGVRIDWLTTRAEISPLAKLVGLCNRLRFEHEPFHREFYDNVRFTPEEVMATRDGLDVKTLQLPLGVAGILRALRKWPRMRAANWLGFSRAVGRQAAAEVCCSGAVGVLSVNGATPECFMDGGRALERIWTAAAVAGLGFHPTASLPVFLAYAQRTDGRKLPSPHRELAGELSQQFRKRLPLLAGRTVHMVFRVGESESVPARSLRRN